MKKLLTLLTLIITAACADENFAPEPCSSLSAIPEIDTFVGGTVSLSACFEDDRDDMLTISAQSSDKTVVRAVVSPGFILDIFGVSKGNAIVTVTAIDMEGGTGMYDITVTVSNQPPEAVGSIPTQSIEAGDLRTLDLNDYFTDADGQKLVYKAIAANATIVGLFLSESNLDIVGASGGSTKVTITATDPDGDEAVQVFDITVTSVVPSVVFEDSFSGPLSTQWRTSGPAKTEFNEGILSLWGEGGQGQMILGYERIKLWSLEARLRKTDNSATSAVFGLLGNGNPYRFLVILLRANTIEFLINEYDSSSESPVESHVWLSTQFTEPGVFAEFKIYNDLLRGWVITVNGAEAIVVENGPGIPSPPRTINDAILIAANLISPTSTTSRVEIDWIKISGVPVGSSSDSPGSSRSLTIH